MVIEHDQAQRHYEDSSWIGSCPSKTSVYSYNALPVNCEQDWKLSATVQFVLSPYDGAPYIEERHSSYLETLTHGIMD